MRTNQAIISLALAVAFIVSLTGCGDAPISETKATKATKAEWREKLASRYGQTAQMNIVNNWKPADFKSFMGEPSSTQTVGDQALWYYEFSDGTIQLALYAPNLAVGVMQGNINDY